MPIAIATMYDAMLRQAVNSTTAKINVYNYPLNKTIDTKTQVNPTDNEVPAIDACRNTLNLVLI